MRAGDLRDRVVLEERTDSQDTSAAMVRPSWRAIATLPANVTARNGTEREIAGKLVASMAYEVVVRFRSDITAKHRLIFKGDTPANDVILNITSPPIPDGRRSLKLICEAGKNEG